MSERISFMGVPFVIDPRCPPGMIYVGPSQEPGKFEWDTDSHGNVLRGLGDGETYTATLRWVPDEGEHQ